MREFLDSECSQVEGILPSAGDVTAVPTPSLTSRKAGGGPPEKSGVSYI